MNQVCADLFGYNFLGTLGYLSLGTTMGTLSSIAKQSWIDGKESSSESVKTALVWSLAQSGGILFILSPRAKSTATYFLWNENKSNLWWRVGVGAACAAL